MVALYTPLGKHFLLKGHTTFFLQFQSLDCLLFRTLRLWAFILLFIFGKQLYDNLMVFLLKISFGQLFFGKCNSTIFKSSLPNFVFTLLLEGGLKYMIFILFLFFLFGIYEPYVYWFSKLWPLLVIASLYGFSLNSKIYLLLESLPKRPS